MPTEFEKRVWKLLKKIQKGKVATYKQVAVALGKPKAARAVGNACRKNPFPVEVPCHRVVCSDGSVGDYSKGVRKKIELLRKEGIEIKNNKIAYFKKALRVF